MHLFGKGFAAFLSQGRQVNADDLTSSIRSQAQIRCQNSLFDSSDHRLFPRRDDERASIRYGDRGYLGQGHVGAVIIHFEMINNGGSGTAGAQFSEVLTQCFHAFGHADLCVFLDFNQGHGLT